MTKLHQEQEISNITGAALGNFIDLAGFEKHKGNYNKGKPIRLANPQRFKMS